MTDTWARASAEGALTLIVGWRVGTRVEGGRIELTEEVADSLREVADATLASLAEREAKPYSVDAHVEPEEFFAVAAGSLDYGNEVLTVVQAGAELPRLTAAKLPGRPLLFYASIIGDIPEQRSAFVRTANPVLAVSGGKILSRLRQSLAVLNEPVFSFDRKIDFVITSEGMAVLNQSSFDRLFRDMPEVVERIPEWLQEVSAHLPLDDEALVELEQRCRKDSRLRRRLHAIRDRGHLGTVTLDDVRREADRQGLDSDLVVRNGRLALGDLDPGTLLKLLNEDLMTGGLSGTRFSVDRKSPR